MAFLSFSHTQYLRGLAILLVVISHIGNYSGKTWFTPLGGVGVAIFLFCSAYGLSASYKKNGLKDYWKKKFFAVYLPFLLVETVVAIVLRVSITEYLLDVFFIRWINPNGWYMQYLVICYVLFYCGMRFISNQTVRMCVWGAIALCSFVFCGNLQGEQAISFLLGIIVADNYEKINQYTWKTKLTIGLSLLLVGASALAIKQTDLIRMQPQHVITLLNLLIKTGFMLGLVLLTCKLYFAVPLMNFSSKISYPFYLVHGYFMWIIADDLTGNYFVNSVLMCVISVLLAMLLNETMPDKRKNVK